MDVSSLPPLSVTAPGPASTAQPVQEIPATPPVRASTPDQSAANADAPPSAEKLAGAVNQINDTFARKGLNLYASFEKDKTTGLSVVKIVDKKTNETVNQIPTREILAFAQLLDQQQGTTGNLFNAAA